MLFPQKILKYSNFHCGFLLELSALFVSVLFYYCPHCLLPTSGGQPGNKRQTRHTNRALSSKRKPQYAAKKKITSPCGGVTFHCFYNLVNGCHKNNNQLTQKCLCRLEQWQMQPSWPTQLLGRRIALPLWPNFLHSTGRVHAPRQQLTRPGSRLLRRTRPTFLWCPECIRLSEIK